ncbi:uncharacterized protein LOC130135284 [Syzygium oleosum]|uniref:uncharacterized protein LOC130135284 n=1 Tax=Syzygium oleosum TaxID=219896 RepID=UPI0024BA0F3D|nr:uncharacterized protein LOC130135284 [Syzygium oleosum]
MEGVPCPLSKHQNLILRAPVSQWELPGIACMLRSSRRLEILVIHRTRSRPLTFKLDEESIERFNEDFWSRKGNFQCLAKHLKRVEIIGFAISFGSKHLLALIKFLLGDALTLEKMIIEADFHAQRGQKHLEAADLSKLLDVSRNVHSY